MEVKILVEQTLTRQQTVVVDVPERLLNKDGSPPGSAGLQLDEEWERWDTLSELVDENIAYEKWEDLVDQHDWEIV